MAKKLKTIFFVGVPNRPVSLFDYENAEMIAQAIFRGVTGDCKVNMLIAHGMTTTDLYAKILLKKLQLSGYVLIDYELGPKSDVAVSQFCQLFQAISATSPFDSEEILLLVGDARCAKEVLLSVTKRFWGVPIEQRMPETLDMFKLGLVVATVEWPEHPMILSAPLLCV